MLRKPILTTGGRGVGVSKGPARTPSKSDHRNPVLRSRCKRFAASGYVTSSFVPVFQTRPRCKKTLDASIVA